MRADRTLGGSLRATLWLGLLGALLLAAAAGPAPQAHARQREGVAPTVRWRSPAAAATVSSRLWSASSARRGRCRVSATDDVRVAKVIFYAGARRLNTDRAAPYDCRPPRAPLAAGRLTLKAVAYDAAGNRRTSTRSVRVTRGATAAATQTPAAAAAAPAAGLAPPAGRTLVFADDFDGRAVDTRAWGLYDGPGNGGHGLRRPSAFSVENGQLVVTASWDGMNITSGGMSQERGNDAPYGRFEVRVRTEGDPSLRTSGAVLTWPRSQRWPQDGELDIYETGIASAARTPFFSYLHWRGGTWGGDQDYVRHEADAREWHVMTMDWDPHAIRIYRDGTLVGELTDPAKIPDVAHNLCIQLDAYSNGPLATPVHMYVDWVRVYR